MRECDLDIYGTCRDQKEIERNRAANRATAYSRCRARSICVLGGSLFVTRVYRIVEYRPRAVTWRVKAGDCYWPGDSKEAHGFLCFNLKYEHAG